MQNTNKISLQASQLKKIRLYLGFTRAQFGEILSISQYTIRSWENGQKEFTEEGAKRFIDAIKNSLGLECSLQWLFLGKGTSPIAVSERSSKLEEMSLNTKQLNLLQEMTLFQSNCTEAEIILIEEQQLAPFLRKGDYVGLVPFKSRSFNKLLDQLVFIIFENDEQQMGLLTKEKNSYKIEKFSSKASLIKLNTIKKLYQVVWIRKAI